MLIGQKLAKVHLVVAFIVLIRSNIFQHNNTKKHNQGETFL